MDRLQDYLEALHVNTTAPAQPQVSRVPPMLTADLNAVVIKFLNATLRLIPARGRPLPPRFRPVAVGLTLRTLYDALFELAADKRVDQMQILIALATYSIFLSWWRRFLKVEKMPQFLLGSPGIDTRHERLSRTPSCKFMMFFF